MCIIAFVKITFGLLGKGSRETHNETYDYHKAQVKAKEIKFIPIIVEVE